MNKKLLFLILLLIPVLCFAQTNKNKIKGCVIDITTGKPIPFVNIQVNDLSIGTSADIDGCFIIQTNIDIKYLNFSHINYAFQKIYPPFSNEKVLYVYLESKHIELAEIVVFPGINPAHRIIDSMIKHIPDNNPKNFNSFSYTIYEKFIFTIDAEIDSLEKARQNDTTMEVFFKVMKSIDLFLSENVIERTYIKPDRTYDKVTATRMSGMKEPAFSLLITRLQSLTFYDPIFSIMDKNYINPVSKGSTQKYMFSLQDTIFSEQGDSVFVISYRPFKYLNFDGLKGVLYINQDGWAVQSATAEPQKQSESINISIAQKYKKVDDNYWFPYQINADILAPLLQVSVDSSMFSLKGVGRSYIIDVSVNQPVKRFGLGEVGVEYMPKSTEKDSVFWDANRVTPLSEKDKNTYRVIDSIGEEIKIDKYAKWLMTLTEAKIKFKWLNIELSDLMDYTKYQGYSLGLGLSTNDDLSRFFSLGGFFGYSFGDKKWKYGGDVTLNLYRPLNFKVKLEYQNKAQNIGLMQLPFENENILNPQNFQHCFADRGDYTEKFGGKFIIHPLNYVQTEIGFYKKIQEPSYEYIYVSNPELKKFHFTELNVGLRWAFREEFLKTPRSTFSLGTKYPVFRLNYTHGFKDLFGGDFDFNRFDFSIEKKFDTRFLGTTTLLLQGGTILEDMPYSKLFNQIGTFESFTIYAPNSFGTMKSNEFVNDSYIGFFFSHNFKQLLFKPNSSWFKPEPEIVTNIGFGWLRKPENHQLIEAKPMDLGFYESGLNIHKILSTSFAGIGVGLLYRYGPYSYSEYWQNFAAKITVSIGLF